MEGEFWNRRHKGYQTSEDVIDRVVRDVIGDSLASYEAITVGYANEVYRAVTGTGGEIVIRISRHGGVGFREEVKALEQCRHARIPVPRVYGVRTIEDGADHVDVMVMQHLSGVALSDVYPSLDKLHQQTILRELGELLRAMHSIPIAAFGLLTLNGDGPTRWDDYVGRVVADRIADVPHLIDAGLSKQEAQELVRVVESLAAFHHPHPVLCHGDLGMDHVFIEGSHISGIIDFGLAQGGAGAMDIAILTMYHPDIPINDLLTVYDDPHITTVDGQSELIAHQVNTAAMHLAHNMRDGNHDVRDLIVAALQELLDTRQR